MGIAHELNREGITSADVHLAVGLPLTWVNRQREDFRKYMLQRESVDFKYEDKLYSIRIIGCSVIGAGATILPGICVGAHSIVGASPVVTKDVPDCAAVVGNPARVVKMLDAEKFR